jgi:hypothetical protein
MLHQMPESALQETQIAMLRYQGERARQSYDLAERSLDCVKMSGYCFEIGHNRSLMGIQLAQRQLRFAQELSNDKTAATHYKSIQSNLREARQLFNQAIADCGKMRRRPPRFAFIDERIVTARQGLLTLQNTEIRAQRTALSYDLEALLSAKKIPDRKAENLSGKMEHIAQNIRAQKDSLRFAGRELGNEFVQVALFNLQLENFTLHFNLANLRFRMALEEFESAVGNNSLPSERLHIRHGADRALQSLKEASSALDYLEDSGKLPASSIQQKHLQVNKLSKALREFLDHF